MSFASVLPYFRSRMNALDFKEWDDAFAVNNIPESILDLSYHLRVGVTASGPANHTVHNFLVPVEVRAFFKGFQDPGLAMNNVMANVDLVLEEVLKIENRVGRTDGIKDVRPINIAIDPVDGSNDNDIVVTFTFDVQLICAFSN